MKLYHYFVSYVISTYNNEKRFGMSEYSINEIVSSFEDILEMRKAIEENVHYCQRGSLIIIGYQLIRVEKY